LFSFVYSFFSLIWLYIILKISSPNQIDLWEAVLSIFFYILLLTITLTIDKWFGITVFADEQRFQKNLENLNKLMKVKLFVLNLKLILDDANKI
jgi:hypothetical protein